VRLVGLRVGVRCAKSSGIYMPNCNFLAFVVFEISAFIRTDRQTDMARSVRLVIRIKNICILRGLVYSFTLRVAGIKMHWPIL